jgi:tetratricopeptide (TPR) repeat protein
MDDGPELERLSRALAGRYAVQRELGRGGMGTVYLAEDMKHGRQVAIKVLHADLASGVASERFLREIRISAYLSHPHIIALFDSGEVDGRPYYVMPYVDGESLRARLDREGQLPIADALRITGEVAAALDHAHAQGVVHRDVKPENILLTEGGTLIADFGIAHAIGQAGGERLTRTGIAIGTPAYMAPEQMGASPIDGRADQYSLACVAYEMLAGYAPFAGPTPQVVMARHAADEVPPLRSVRKTVPEGLEGALVRALEKTPADRFESCASFTEVLSAVGPARKAMPKQRVALMAVAALAIVALAYVGVRTLTREGEADPVPAGATGDLVANRVAVLPFENQTADSSSAMIALGESTARSIVELLEGLGTVETVPLRQLSDLADGEAATTAGAMDLARATQARILVTGAFHQRGDSLEFLAEVTDVAEGRTVETVVPTRVDLSGPLLDLETLRSDVAGAVAYYADPWSERLGLRDRPSLPNLEAYREFSEGNRHDARSELAAASLRYQAAWEKDTTFLSALFLSAWASMPAVLYTVRADSLVQLLEARRTRLSPIELAALDQLQAVLAGDLLARLEAARRERALNPSDGTNGALGFVALDANRPLEALDAFAAIDTSQFWGAREYPQFWRKWAEVYHALDQHEEELEIARQGVRRFPGTANVNGAEMHALAALGRVDEIEDVIDRFRGMQHNVPWSNMLSEWFVAGRICMRHGHLECADRLLRQLIADYEGRLPDPDAALNLARAHAEAGRDEEASRLYSDVEGLARVYAAASAYQIVDRFGESAALYGGLLEDYPDRSGYHWYHGMLAARLGDEETALEQERWLARWDHMYRDWFRSGIYAHLGQRERAIELFRRAVAEGLPIWPYSQQYTLGSMPLWGDPEFEAIFEPKG